MYLLFCHPIIIRSSISFRNILEMSAASGELVVEPTPQCQYTVPRKKRLCRMTVRPGKRYCGEHDRPDPTIDSSANSTEIDARIPCPLDPKHTCYASKLEKHLKVCNARSGETPAYINRGCNSTVVETAEQRVRLKDVPADKLKTVVELVERLYKELVSTSMQCRTESDSDPVHPSVLEDYELEERARSSLRHLRQTSSLLHTLQREGLLAENTCYVELGAGKGHVSYYLSRAVQHVPSCSVLLVDRASHRHKQDNKLDPSQHRVSRIRADINDLLLGQVEDVKKSHSVVAITKHLCGVATDYALRCVTAPSVMKKTRGVVMATCCHHRCTASSYVAWEFLKEKGITREYFDIIMGVVSWATCGTGYSRDRRIQEGQLSDNKRQKLSTGNTKESESRQTNSQSVMSPDNNSKECNIEGIKSDINCEIILPNVHISETTHQTSLTDVSIDNSADNTDLTDASIGNNADNTVLAYSNIGNSAVNTHLADASIGNSAVNVNLKYTSIENIAVNTDLTDAIIGNSALITDLTDASTVNSADNMDLTDVKGLGLTVERRTEIGRHAKALLDYGRMIFLKECGFDVKLCYYVDIDVSPENVCIVAKKEVM